MMGQSPLKISIITATWNSSKTIRSAVESVLSQDHGAIEYIVIDGGSSDGTLEILKEYEDQIDVLVSEPDKGIYDALNKGIQRASGDLVGFLHSDDLFASPGVISAIATAAQDGDVQAVYGDLNYVGFEDTGRIIRRWTSRNFRPGLLKQGWMPPHPTLYVRREQYERLGGFDLNYRIAADYDCILRLFSQPGFSCRYVPQTFVSMRVGGASNANLKAILRKSSEDFRALRNNGIAFAPVALLWKNLSKLHQFFR